MVVIATDKMYLVGKRIYSVFMDEDVESRSIRNKKEEIFSYLIRVSFEPEDSAVLGTSLSSRSNDIMTVEFKVYGHKRATEVYRDIVRQIREQCPDQLYLDKIAEDFLARSTDDISTAEICRARETERRSKEVLRRSKRGVRRRY